MKTPAQILAEINMILARRLTGELNDEQAIELIEEVMDSPDAMVLSLDLPPPDQAPPEPEL